MELQDVSLKVKLKGTTVGASDTVAIGSFRFDQLADNDTDPNLVGPCVVKARAHVIVYDVTNSQTRSTDFDLCWQYVGGTASLQVASGSPTYVLLVGSNNWTFTWGITGAGKVMSATVTSQGTAGGITANASGWLELDVHY